MAAMLRVALKWMRMRRGAIDYRAVADDDRLIGVHGKASRGRRRFVIATDKNGRGLTGGCNGLFED